MLVLQGAISMHQAHLQLRAHGGPEDRSSLVFYSEHSECFSVRYYQWLPTANRLKAPSLAGPSIASTSDLHTLSQSLCLIHSFIHSPFILNTDSLPLLMLQKLSLALGL